jgi:hypothetical protein
VEPLNVAAEVGEHAIVLLADRVDLFIADTAGAGYRAFDHILGHDGSSSGYDRFTDTDLGGDANTPVAASVLFAVAALAAAMLGTPCYSTCYSNAADSSHSSGLQRKAGRADLDSSGRTETPKRRASPRVGRKTPTNSRNSVVLPAPLGPTSPVPAPGSTTRSIPSIPTTGP